MRKLTKKTLAILLALSMVVSLCGLTALATGEEPAGIGTEETGNLQEGQEPAGEPTGEPTDAPTEEPAGEPTGEPTDAPTEEPAGEPTVAPTEEPTEEPAGEPTDAPTEEPTEELVPNKGPAKVRTAAPVEEEPESPVENLKKAATEGGEVTLTEAVTLDKALTIEKDLTISGGTINGTLEVAEGVTLTLDGVTITATAGPGIAVTGTGVTLEVKGENTVESKAEDPSDKYTLGYAGVQVCSGAALTIIGDGTLHATGCSNGAGIGGNGDYSGGAVQPNGNIVIDMTGTIYAQGGSNNGDNAGGAGIGAGGRNSGETTENSGSITINNGTIYATGGKTAAGIGSGHHVDSGVITIAGGNITATGGETGGPGIGAGYGAKGAVTINISDGKIVAQGNWLAAGIGSSYKGGGANVAITGGDITATGGNGNPGSTYQGAPGIGSGYQGGGGAAVTISGGKVNATGGWSAPGIGSGALSNKNADAQAGENKVEITGGEIVAQGGCNAPGIGGGNATDNITVTITGGTIDAKGGTCTNGTEVAPGIGSATRNDVNKPGDDGKNKKYHAETTGSITIGADAELVDGTTVGAPAGNKFYECTVQPDGSRVYKTTEYAAETVALLISDENTTAYSDLAQAVGAAQEGDTVRLVANVTLDAMLTLRAADLTLDLNGRTLTVSGTPNTAVYVNGGNIHVTSTAEAKGQIICAAKNEVIYAQGALAMKLSNVTIVGGDNGAGLRLYGTGTNGAEIEKCEIKNVQNGIMLYKVRTTENGPAIVSMKDTVIEAAALGMEIYMSECALLEGCDITGGKAIVVKGNNGDPGYPTTANVKGGTLIGTSGPAVEISDANWWTSDAKELTIKTEINDTALSGKDGRLVESVEREQTVGKVKFETTVVNTNAVCYLTENMGAAEGGKKVFYTTYAEALSKSKTITVLETNADPGNYTMSEGETITSINGDIKDHLTAPEGFAVKVAEDPAGTFTYTLGVAVTGITLNRTTASVYTGNTVTLTATVTPDNADDKTVTWTSSNEAVATVDQSGVVTARSNGTATITATVGGKSATCVVTVSTYSSGGSSSDRDDREPSRPTPSAEPTVTPAPSAEPTPTVEPAPAPSEEPLAEPDVPLAEIPEENLTDPEPPLAEVPDELSGEEDLGEPDVPLADVPKTGDSLVSWLALAVASGMGLAWLGLSKRKEDET